MTALALHAQHRRLDDDATPAYHYNGHLFAYLMRPEQNVEGLMVIDALVRRGFEPPIHVHSSEDECFYVLEGEVEYLIGDDLVLATAGSFVHLPRGQRHGFRFVTETARLLILTVPGAGLERTFRDFSVPAATRELPDPAGVVIDVPKQVEVLAREGITVTGPPHGA